MYHYMSAQMHTGYQKMISDIMLGGVIISSCPDDFDFNGSLGVKEYVKLGLWFPTILQLPSFLKPFLTFLHILFSFPCFFQVFLSDTPDCWASNFSPSKHLCLILRVSITLLTKLMCIFWTGFSVQYWRIKAFSTRCVPVFYPSLLL